MERIGIAASKIAKGNLFLYNLFVILISFLFAILIYFLSGTSIVLVLVLVAILTHGGQVPDFYQIWMPFMLAILLCLAAIIGLFTLVAILKNIKFRRKS
ncbi:MAG: hypothetical protein ABIJ41_01335 [Candidatus Omnitrophota bacterium]